MGKASAEHSSGAFFYAIIYPTFAEITFDAKK